MCNYIVYTIALHTVKSRLFSENLLHIEIVGVKCADGGALCDGGIDSEKRVQGYSLDWTHIEDAVE
jgi:hypothetical protein